MKILYYDCFAGISGDMNLGAMIDLGVEPEYLRGELKKLNVGGYEIAVQRDRRNGLAGARVDVLPASGEGATDGPHAGHRRFADIVKLIRECGLSDPVKSTSLNIFQKLAEAEAKVHGHGIEDVHFHEVGAVDSIIDIVGAAVCLDYFKADRILSSAVQTGGGFVRCAHGTLPVPAPATAEILRGIPVKTGAVPFECTTPTGAAILAATVAQFTDRLRFTPTKTGYGIGQRSAEIPNVLRVFLGEMAEEAVTDDVAREDAVLMECNIDDMNPEMYDFIMDAFFSRGARDVYLTPVIMKKSRPAVKISVLCAAGDREAMEEVFWLQTSTFGLRWYPVSRAMLTREYSRQSTRHGEVSVKHACFRGRRIKSKPEYEECRKLAVEKNVSLREIYEELKGEKTP